MKLSVTIRARIKGEKISNERKKRKGRGERKNRKTVGKGGGMEGSEENNRIASPVFLSHL